MFERLKAKLRRALRGRQTITKKVGGKIGRNEPCPCGSGRKYKRCCGGVRGLRILQ